MALVIELQFITPRHPDYQAEVELRWRVLRAPLGMPRSRVAVSGEAESLHLVAKDAGVVIGCVLHSKDEEGDRLRAMAVDDARRGEGIGAMLVTRMEEELASRGVETVVLHAREVAVGFYAKCGYAPYGETFTEVGIPHVRMKKSLIRG